MTATNISSRVKGKTFRFAWTSGPTAGVTHEHVFHEDGTVSYGKVEEDRKPGKYATEKQYAAFDVSAGVVLVSYLSASSGFTLTVAMNFGDHRLYGVASGGKDWFACLGNFDEVEEPRGSVAKA